MDEARYTHWMRQKLVKQVSECGCVLWKVEVRLKKVQVGSRVCKEEEDGWCEEVLYKVKYGRSGRGSGEGSKAGVGG